jgi:hypothetical protein
VDRDGAPGVTGQDSTALDGRTIIRTDGGQATGGRRGLQRPGGDAAACNPGKRLAGQPARLRSLLALLRMHDPADEDFAPIDHPARSPRACCVPRERGGAPVKPRPGVRRCEDACATRSALRWRTGGSVSTFPGKISGRCSLYGSAGRPRSADRMIPISEDRRRRSRPAMAPHPVRASIHVSEYPDRPLVLHHGPRRIAAFILNDASEPTAETAIAV